MPIRHLTRTRRTPQPRTGRALRVATATFAAVSVGASQPSIAIPAFPAHDTATLHIHAHPTATTVARETPKRAPHEQHATTEQQPRKAQFPTLNAHQWAPKYHVQYTGELPGKLNADVYNLDVDSVKPAQVQAIRKAGGTGVCYVNSGAWESWRSDKDAFPASVLGKPMADWDGERWLDIRNTKTLLPIMSKRMDHCKAMGFLAIDADNADVYTQTSGFHITGEHQVTYLRALAAMAHDKGLFIGLKNNIEQIPQLIDVFDFAVNEQCHEWRECHAYAPFIARRKPVFVLEYDRKFCSRQDPMGMRTYVKRLELGQDAHECP